MGKAPGVKKRKFWTYFLGQLEKKSKRGCSLSCMASLLLGAILVFSILSIHTVLLKERQRIENIEQTILTQQKQWSDIWVKSREEDEAKSAARAADADTNAQMIIEKVQEIADSAPEVAAVEPVSSDLPISSEVIEEILKDSLAVPPEAGQAPDYHDERIPVKWTLKLQWSQQWWRRR